MRLSCGHMGAEEEDPMMGNWRLETMPLEEVPGDEEGYEDEGEEAEDAVAAG